MQYKYLLFSKADRIGTVTINRPESLNALSKDVYIELYEMFSAIAEDADVDVIILTGSGEKAFVAGADIAYMQPKNSIEINDFTDKARLASDKIYSIKKTTIAAIHGFCLGGGLELAMCCDLRIASDKAKFGQPEINLGIIPGAGGTQRLTQLVGMGRAKEMVYTGVMIDAATALSYGLINKVVAPELVADEAKAMATKIISKSKIALSLAKESITLGANMTLPAGLDLENKCFSLCFATEDQKEGMQAFLEKRKPAFKGK